MSIRTTSADATRALAARLATALRPGDVVVLGGDVGSGKTTFAQGLARGLGVSVRVTSPTFALVREYEGQVPLVHLDVYRLEHLQEVRDLGFDEIVGGDSVVIVEWGDVLGPLLPGDRLDVRLEADPDDDGARFVTLSPRGSTWATRPLDVAVDTALGPGERAHEP